MSETTQEKHTAESLLADYPVNTQELNHLLWESLSEKIQMDVQDVRHDGLDLMGDFNALHQIEKSLTKSEWERYTDQIRLYLQERYNTGFYGEPEEKIAEWTRKLEAHEIAILLILTLQAAEPL